jgi:hypothetical protein
MAATRVGNAVAFDVKTKAPLWSIAGLLRRGWLVGRFAPKAEQNYR